MYRDDILYYEDGEVIFEEDSIGKKFYIIEDGKVEISQRIDGKKVTIAVFGAGDFFGEMAVIADAPRSATATAVGKATLWSLSPEMILRRMQADPQFTVNLFQTLVTRLRSTTYTLRTLISRMYAIDTGFVGTMFPDERYIKAEEMIRYLKEQIEFKDRQIEHQQAMIKQLSENAKA